MNYSDKPKARMISKQFLLAVFAASSLLSGCSGESSNKAMAITDNAMPVMPMSEKGLGKFQHVELTSPLDETMVKRGLSVYEVKCAACHKLSDEKLVGPGFKGVTGRRTPEWIMNFITNVDEMLNKDPHAKAMLEICNVRMPYQPLSDEEVRALLEFMRNNDSEA